MEDWKVQDPPEHNNCVLDMKLSTVIKVLEWESENEGNSTILLGACFLTWNRKSSESLGSLVKTQIAGPNPRMSGSAGLG